MKSLFFSYLAIVSNLAIFSLICLSLICLSSSNTYAHISFSPSSGIPSSGNSPSSGIPSSGNRGELQIFSPEPTFPFNDNWRLEGVKPNKIFLTIDDGPTPGVTDALLKVLKDYEAHATFFVVGQRVKHYPSIVKLIHQDGHEIGNHTYNHELDFKTKEDFYESLMKTHEAIAPYLQEDQPLIFRAPGGVWNTWRTDLGNSHPVLRDYVGTIYWNVGGGKRKNKNDADWKCWSNNQSVDSCAESYIKEIYKRHNQGVASLVLLHDLDKRTVALTKKILETLANDNIDWEFSFLSDIPDVHRLAEPQE